MAKHNAKQTRPLIGINTDYAPGGKNGSAQLRLHAGYADAIYAAGGLPIIISSALQEKDLQQQVFPLLDGFLLTGSPLELDPARLGMNRHPAVQPMPARREDFDRLLCKMIVERKLPCLAVAAGMLEMNVACGGTIYAHLPSENPKAFPHKDEGGGVHRHLVLLEQNTRLDAVYGGGELRVNSYHLQAVNQLAPCFRPAAKSCDGIIEAYETVDARWHCTGVQWHPHSETASALDMQLFESFVQAATKRELALAMAA
jgi:putative glutamine amidotransferase